MEALQARHEQLLAHLRAKGISDSKVLRALREVPRHRFLPEGLAEFAYQDTPLPIGEEQTISQPYIVAWMTQAAELKPGHRVLEVGTGSGYAAAVASRIAAEVYSVERHRAGRVSAKAVGRAGLPQCPRPARRRDRRLAGAWSVRRHPRYCRWAIRPSSAGRSAQAGRDAHHAGRRASDGTLAAEDLGDVRFVPLIGEEGWQPAKKAASERSIAGLIRESVERFDDIETDTVDALLERMSGARVVLLGEATHGTSEFYRMRARITRELIKRHGFTIVAVEADWPDAARIDRYVRHLSPSSSPWKPFARFPTWMWRNEEVRLFAEWLRQHNATMREPNEQVAFYGLDLYSLFTSADAVVRYLQTVDPKAAEVARQRYGCLTPWQSDPAAYGRAVVTGQFESCEAEAVKVLVGLLAKRLEYSARDGERFLDASQNAKVVANAERYYRIMYRGNVESWNLRDQHMFDTLSALLAFHGPDARAVVWAHNSHLGDAAATEMGVRGEHNVGQLCRSSLGEAAYLVGFGTDHGTVVAASAWDEPPQVKTVRPADPRSYEALCHQSGIPAFFLPFRQPPRESLRAELMSARLERAIGVIYRLETELQSHYFVASLPRQFDEWIWFDETKALHPLGAGPTEAGLPETYPFGL